jgi:hypothetical protein
LMVSLLKLFRKFQIFFAKSRKRNKGTTKPGSERHKSLA